MDRTSSSPEIMNNQQSCICKYLCIPLYTFCVNCWKANEECTDYIVDYLNNFNGTTRQPIETQILHERRERTLPNERHERREHTLPNERHESTITM